MRNDFAYKVLRIGCASLFIALAAFGEQHKWAGRTLNDFEWIIHEKLAAVPHGVFDSLNFEALGGTVTLSGQVLKESAKQRAERSVRRVHGVEKVINHIEVLPASRRDDALRTNVYHAVYDKQLLEKYGARPDPTIHIIVKDGWVTLEGVVDSDADRSMVHLRALKASSHVSDNLRVAPRAN